MFALAWEGITPAHFAKTLVDPSEFNASFNSEGSFDDAPGQMMKITFCGALTVLRVLAVGVMVKLRICFAVVSPL